MHAMPRTNSVIDKFPEFAQRLLRALESPLPGATGQLRMAPRYRAEPERLSVAGKNCKQAGVLLLLVPIDGEPHVLLTVRKATLANHGGQISLPGGRLEDGEDHLAAALRETQEEVSIPASAITVLGGLSPLYIPPSGYCVYPYIGLANTIEPVPDEREVDRILYAPVSDLLDSTRHRVGTRSVKGVDYNVPYFDICGEMVWGATAMILAEFITIVETFPEH